ncbi:MAG: hypothetical protein IJW55_04325 [Clostridia bacterium]|nr:hypothetical protein [Clostridia bacterium]
MSNVLFDFLLYVGKLLLLTLGVFVVCGFAVRFCSRAFSSLSGSGSGAVFDITSIIGTPVHELGHAVMCPLFGHKITRMKLWSPRAENGVYGYVEHSYNRKNPWAQFGNLLIGIGPIFSGLGVVILMLWLCFPSQWDAYLTSSRTLVADGTTVAELTSGVLSLFRAILGAFKTDWLRSLIGVLIILPVSLHISLSWADVKGSLGALPVYLLMLAVFALVTSIAGVAAPVLSGLWLLNLRVLSIFCLVIAFAAVWVLIALLIRLVRIIIGWF